MPIRLQNTRGLVTPPQPFAEAERKAGPNGPQHNTVPGKLPTVQIGLFPAGRDPVRAWVSKIWAAKALAFKAWVF